MAIELAVSRAITKIHALERALYEPGPWYVRTGSFMVPADREVTDQAVSFRFHVPARCGGLAELWLRDEFVIVIRDVSGGAHGSDLAYELSLSGEMAA